MNTKGWAIHRTKEEFLPTDLEIGKSIGKPPKAAQSLGVVQAGVASGIGNRELGSLSEIIGRGVLFTGSI